MSVLDPLYRTLGTVLAGFYAVFPSYFFAIAMLTLAVRVVLIPLTAKQVKSQQAMQRVQPEMKRLQAKHRGDRQKLNEEMMKLYKEHQVNPLSGCLPILLQMPLFIVLYRLILDLSKVPPRHLPTDSNLHEALAESGGRMVSLGMDLSDKATSVSGFADALPFYLLVAVVVATGFYQQRQMTARMPPGSMNPQMQIVGKVFPAMIGLVSLSVPAGVVVYFAVSNLWQIAQQAVTFRAGGPLAPAHKAKDGTGKDAGKDGAGKNGKDGGKGSGATGAKSAASGGAKGSANAKAGGGGNRGGGGAKQAPRSGAKSGGPAAGSGNGTAAGGEPSRWWKRLGTPPAAAGSSGNAKKPSGASGNARNAKSTQGAKNAKNANAKNRRPPPSPRPKGMPPGGARGSKGPRATPPKKDR